MNERLRAALIAAGVTTENLSAKVGVDPKTVERWIATPDRRPHRTTRRQVAQILGVDEVHLWPSLANDLRTKPSSETEVVHIFPTRSAVPVSLWMELIHGVKQYMDVLVFSGQFLVEQYNLIPSIRDRSKQGAMPLT